MRRFQDFQLNTHFGFSLFSVGIPRLFLHECLYPELWFSSIEVSNEQRTVVWRICFRREATLNRDLLRVHVEGSLICQIISIFRSERVGRGPRISSTIRDSVRELNTNSLISPGNAGWLSSGPQKQVRYAGIDTNWRSRVLAIHGTTCKMQTNLNTRQRLFTIKISTLQLHSV